MKKYVFAGASYRGYYMYAKPLLDDYSDVAQLCGVYDINVGRARTFVELSGGDFKVYEDFDEMLRAEKPDCVIVTTMDAFHSEYIIRSLDAGCDVITEKPMTTDDAKCRAILEAEKRSGKNVTVTFNYRFSPFMTKIKEIISGGMLGDVYSVHFEWLLTRNMDFGAHGTSYFRRWNARMKNSSGLLVHKSTHHFDLVNWWINQKPRMVSGFGQLRLYGAKNYPFEGAYTKGQRCSNCPHAKVCEFYYEPDENYKRLYVENEQYDGYMCDNCVYADDIDIYDTMGVTVQYDKGAILTYALNATTPYEGWRISINGSKGRLEIFNPENGFESASIQRHIRFYDLDNNVTDFALTQQSELSHKGGHGGGDVRIRNMVFRGNVPDPLGHAAGTMDGAYSILVGVAANKSIKEGTVVDIEELLNG